MKKFKVTYSDGGFSVEVANDIFELAEHLKRLRRIFFKTPVKIEEIAS